MNYPAIAKINLAALTYNLSKIKEMAPSSKILAMVKCDAYGHGAVPVAKQLESEVAGFGVMFLYEAIQLRQAGITKPIVVLTGFFDESELLLIGEYRCDCLIHNFAQITLLEELKAKLPALKLWLKIDTGMHRLGFQASQVREAYTRLLKLQMVQSSLVLMTHFSDADNLADGSSAKQLAEFKQLVTTLPGEWCLANSAALWALSETHGAWVRPGITLYGASPYDTKNGRALGLKPVMTLTSKLIARHELAAGATVGYGSTFSCPEALPIGIVAMGYGAGYPRNAPSGTPVLVNGIRTQVVGRVAMDMLAVDLRPIPEATLGMPVVLWGEGLPIEEVASYVGESHYELLSRLTARVRFEYYSDAEALR